jgi:hypothetical protein
MENCDQYGILRNPSQRGVNQKAKSAIHGLLGSVFYPKRKIQCNCKLLRKPVHAAQSV